jgi:hypothetical protein
MKLDDLVLAVALILLTTRAWLCKRFGDGEPKI